MKSSRAMPSEAANATGASSLASLDEAGQQRALRNLVRNSWWPNPDTIIEDLLRLSDGTRGRTGPRSYADVEKALAGKRKARAARNAGNRAKLEQERKAIKARRRSPPGQGIADRMLRAMQPGEWYGAGDLARAVGAGRGARSKVAQTLLRRRLVERTRNPAWSSAPVDPWRIMAGEIREPKWLYRLTATAAKGLAA